MLAPLWMLALPFIGALGAWLSLRAGGNTRDRLLAALGSAWLNGGILTLAVPLSMLIEPHPSLSIKLTAYSVYMISWSLPWLGGPLIAHRLNKLNSEPCTSHAPMSR